VNRIRVLAGVAVLLAMLAIGVLLLPPYVRNFRFQRQIDELSRDRANLGRPAELVQVQVAERASRIGLPVTADQVRVAPGKDRTRIEVRYFVRVDLPLYTVDLHFRPSAGGR
jgi:hypothetical protein